MKGAILIITGPSGCGKSSLLKEVFKKEKNIYFSISTTTRKKRDGEVEGKDYHYIDEEEFKQDIENGLFLEWAKVHGNYYGTSLISVIKALKKGELVIFDIDVQGHKAINERFKSITTSLFISTKDQITLQKRLQNRGTDTPKSVETRLKNAVSEMTNIKNFHYLLINDDFEKTLKNLLTIIKSARLKNKMYNIDDFLVDWIE